MSMHWIYIIGFFTILVAIAILAQRLLLKQAFNQVVTIFRENQATRPRTARTLAELNLLPPGFMKRPGTFRDYKHRVVETLVKSGVIFVTEDQKHYLSESELAKSPVRQMLGM